MAISIDDVDQLVGKRVTYIYQYSNWQLPVPEPATVIGRTKKRVRIIHHDRFTGDIVKLVKPENLQAPTDQWTKASENGAKL